MKKQRELKPEQKDLWLNGLYRVYYNLQMGPEFDEIEKIGAIIELLLYQR